MTLAFFRSAWAMAKLVPWWIYALLAAVVYHYAALNLAVHSANVACDKRWTEKIEAQRVAYEKQITDIKAVQQQVITKTITVYRDRIVVQKEKDDAIQKDIQADIAAHALDSPLLAGWVRRDLDAAATGDVPDDSQGTPRPADPVEVAAIVQTAADNYTTCRADQQRLIALQSLVSQLQGENHE